MTSTVPFPWEAFLGLSAFILTPIFAIYWMVGKNKFFRGFCKLWSITFVLGCVGLYVWHTVDADMVADALIIVVVVAIVAPPVLMGLAWVAGCIAGIWQAFFGDDDSYDGGGDYYDGGSDYYEEPSYSAPKRKSNFGMWYDVNEPTEHKPFPERKPAAPPPPRPEPVRQKSYKVQRMDRGGYWSTKYSTNNLRIAEQQMRSYMNGAYRLQDENQANVRWRIVDEDGRMVL